MSTQQTPRELIRLQGVAKFQYHSKILSITKSVITTHEGIEMNPLDTITGTIVTGFVLAIIIMLVL